MSYRIVEKKLKEDGQLCGYLLEQDGIEMVVEMRDLYDSTIVEGLRAAGYQYHDYYGDITNEVGIPINELTATTLSPEDNTSFMGMLAETAYTEQQMLQYFSLNMKNLQTVEFREPIEVLIHTREELVQYLLKFNRIRSTAVAFDELRPLNAICAKEALFTVQELEEDQRIQEYMGYIEKRRTFITRSMLRNTQDFFISQGLMSEEERDDADIFVKAWCAWGPEGINATCIEQRWQQDVIYPIDVPYTGTGSEEITFQSVAPALRRKVSSSTLSQVRYKGGLGLIDRQGNIHFYNKKVTPLDVIENKGDVLLTDEEQQKYNKARKNIKDWKSDYKPVKVIQIKHMNRMAFTLQIETGQLYQYRMDRRNVALVSTHGRVFSTGWGSIKTITGTFVDFDRAYESSTVVENVIFNKLARELVANRTVTPIFRSTVEMCEKAGMHYEQALDYIQSLNGEHEASPMLHDDIPSYFIETFGDGLDELDQNSTLFDKLEILLENYLDMTDPASDNYFDVAKILQEMGKFGTPEYSTALYCIQSHPEAKINAVLDFNTDTVAGEQKMGKSLDSKEYMIDTYVSLIATAYYLNNTEYSMTNLGAEMHRIQDNEYFDMDDVIKELNFEYIGSIKDYGNLMTDQLTQASYSCWALGVIGEFSALPVHERRHLAFYGLKMDIQKGTPIRNCINSMLLDIEMQVKKQHFYVSTDAVACIRFFYGYVLKALWGARMKSTAFKEDANGDIYLEATCYDTLGDKHVAQIRIQKRYYDYIINPACESFTPYITTLYDWCRHSMSAFNGTLEFYALSENIVVNPWYVTTKKGYNDISVYNGAINLVDDETWESVYGTSRKELYDEVKRVAGRANPNPILLESRVSLFPNIGNVVVDKEIFASENQRIGAKGNRLPDTMLDYYLDNSSFMETMENYYLRCIKKTSQFAKSGQQLVVDSLKSDKYYSEIASMYSINAIIAPFTAPIGEHGRPTLPAEPITTANTAVKQIDTSMSRIYTFDEYNLSTYDLVRCTELVTGKYEPRTNVFVGQASVTYNNKRYKLAEITESMMQDMVNAGAAYQINATVYLIYAVNGTFFVEVK